jgi:methionine sulfoxide reductase heme-binding subunit
VSVHDHLWWLISRSSGVMALVAMTVSTILGLMLANGLAGRRVKGAAIAVHEHLSLIALIGIGVHGAALLGDTFLHPSVGDVVVPGLIDYRPVGVASGIVGGYLAAIFGLTFYFRRRLGSARWRALHRFSAFAWVLAVIHTLAAGSDAESPWLRVPVLASVAVVAALLARRGIITASARATSTPTGRAASSTARSRG